MYWLLVHVSGIPPLEAHMLRSRKDAFRDYQGRVSAFWPPSTRPPRGLPPMTLLEAAISAVETTPAARSG